MSQKSNVQVVYLEIQLGGTPSFEIKADPDGTVDSQNCHYTCTGTTGPGDAALLQQVMSKIQKAYGRQLQVPLCINDNGWQIVNDSQCTAPMVRPKVKKKKK